MMKKPKYAALRTQQQLDAGINGFAVELMAESHADRPERWRDETILLRGTAHNGAYVYMLISTECPELEQFKDWPT
jgi:hypothetical protein